MFGLFGSHPFTPEKDIPSLAGKVIIVTGGNGGLGYESLIHLARHDPAKIYLCARSRAKYDAAMRGIAAAGVPNATSIVKFLELDLTSLASVAAAADAFAAENSRLDILMNNAGIMAQPPALTKDGYEIQFGTNHIGHALFTKKLMPILEKTANAAGDVRIINVTSEGHKFAPKPTGFIPEACTTDMSTYNTWSRYGQSKLANILFTRELARRYPAVTSVAIHPGGVATGLSGPFQKEHPWLSAVLMPIWHLIAAQPTVGAWNQTWACVAPVEGKAGTGKEGMKPVKQAGYYVPVTKEGSQTAYAKDPELARRLWEWTEAELKKHGY